MKWGDHKTLKFIRLYRMHPCLWDTSSRDYNVRNRRDEALNAILAKMNIPNFTHAACKTKIKNIRSQYCHELKRIRLSMRGGGRVHKPTLAWFDTVDSFLRPIVVQRTQNLFNDKHQIVLAGQASPDAVDSEFIDHSRKVADDTSKEENILKTEEIDISDIEAEDLLEGQTVQRGRHNVVESTSTIYSSNYESNSEERRIESESLKLLTTTMKKLENSLVKNTAVPSNNEFDVFGQSVAVQLSNMPIEDALQLQLEIQQLITTKRISKLNRAQDNRHY